jgi:hypothetical protein
MTEIALTLIPPAPSHNYFTLNADSGSCRIPLSQVIDVWPATDHEWAITVLGSVSKGSSKLYYYPVVPKP